MLRVTIHKGICALSAQVTWDENPPEISELLEVIFTFIQT